MIPYRVRFQGQDDKTAIEYAKDMSGGQNTRVDASNLQPNQATKLLNADISIPGEKTKRKGTVLYDTDLGSTKINALAPFSATVGGTQKLHMSTGTKWYEGTTTTTFAEVTGTTITAVDSEFVVGGGYIFRLNQTDAVNYSDGDGTASVMGVTSADAPKGKVGAYFQNRLWIANTASYPDFVYFSNVFTHLDGEWDQNVQVFKVAPGGNDAIKTLVPFRKTREIFILKEDSIHKLLVAGPPSTWYLTEVDMSHGCVATRTALSIGNDIYYLSRDGVRSLRTTESNIEQGFDLPLSYGLKDIWESRNGAQIHNACAIYWNNKYFLSFATGTKAYNDTTLVYNLGTKSWSYYTGISPAVWAVWAEAGIENLYYGESQADSTVYQAETGTLDDSDGSDAVRGVTASKATTTVTATVGTFLENDPGRKLLWSNGTVDTIKTYTDSTHVVVDDTGTIASTTATIGQILYQEESRELDFGAPSEWKVGGWVEVKAQSGGNYDITVSYKMDQASTWSTLGVINLQGTEPELGVSLTLPFTLTEGNVISERFTLNGLGQFKRIQLQFEEDTSPDEVKMYSYSIRTYLEDFQNR